MKDPLVTLTVSTKMEFELIPDSSQNAGGTSDCPPKEVKSRGEQQAITERKGEV